MGVEGLAGESRGGLAATNGVDDFDLIAFAQGGGGVLTARHDIQVEFHCNPAAGNSSRVNNASTVVPSGSS